MAKTKEQLLNIWFNIWQIPGWFRILTMSKDYDQEDSDGLEEIDEEAIDYLKKAEKVYYEDRPRIRQQIDEFKETFSTDFKRDRRLGFLNDQINVLEKKIRQIWKDLQDSLDQDVPYFLRIAVREIRDPESLEKELRSLSVEKHLLEHPEDLKKVDWVTPEQIARALTYSFDQLIQINQAGFALCPFHEEKTPSFRMYKETNSAYCFGCHWGGNVIQFLMDRDNLNFKEAVRALLL